MSNDSQKQKGPSAKLFIILALIAVGIGIVLTMQNRTQPPAPAAKNPGPAQPAETASAARPSRPAPSLTPPAPTDESAPEPAENAQRAYLVEDFRDTNKDWSRYKMNNVKITSEGIKLEDGKTEGTFEAPCTALKLPSNMVALLWKQTLPDGTIVKPEVQLSYDCQNWSAWYPVESTGDDINPLYPDGSPNPNYGYVPGSYVSLGLDLCPFMRYRFTLQRVDVSKQSPLVPSARVYHLDSSLGEGKTIADVSKFPPGPEEWARRAAEEKAAEEKAAAANATGNNSTVTAPDAPTNPTPNN